MENSFLIEVSGNIVGFAVREGEDYKFFSFDERYQRMDEVDFEDFDSVVACANEVECSFIGEEDADAGSPLELV